MTTATLLGIWASQTAYTPEADSALQQVMGIDGAVQTFAGNDIGGVSTPLHPDTGNAQIFIYDGYPGGVGIAEKGYEIIEELWAATLRAVEECPCRDGCPACIQSPKCGNNNEPLDKRAAVMLIRGLLGVV